MRLQMRHKCPSDKHTHELPLDKINPLNGLNIFADLYLVDGRLLYTAENTVRKSCKLVKNAQF